MNDNAPRIFLGNAILDALPRGSDGENLSLAIHERLNEVYADALKSSQSHIALLHEKLRYIARGFEVVEECLLKANKAEFSDAPASLDADGVAIYHQATGEAYRHALEMCNDSLKEFVENGFMEPKVSAERQRC